MIGITLNFIIFLFVFAIQLYTVVELLDEESVGEDNRRNLWFPSINILFGIIEFVSLSIIFFPAFENCGSSQAEEQARLINDDTPVEIQNRILPRNRLVVVCVFGVTIFTDMIFTLITSFFIHNIPDLYLYLNFATFINVIPYAVFLCQVDIYRSLM